MSTNLDLLSFYEVYEMLSGSHLDSIHLVLQKCDSKCIAFTPVFNMCVFAFPNQHRRLNQTCTLSKITTAAIV